MLSSTLAPVENPASQETSKDPREVEERKAGLKSGRKADKERGSKDLVSHPPWGHENTQEAEVSRVELERPVATHKRKKTGPEGQKSFTPVTEPPTKGGSKASGNAFMNEEVYTLAYIRWLMSE